MVGVQHFLCMFQVQIILGHIVPRQFQHEFHIVVLYAVIRCGRIIFLQLGHLFLEGIHGILRPVLLGGFRTEFLQVFILIHTQLFLNGTELVIKVILPLLLVDFRLYLGVYLLLDFQKFHLGVENIQQLHRTSFHILEFEQCHFVIEIIHIDGGGDEVHEE